MDIPKDSDVIEILRCTEPASFKWDYCLNYCSFVAIKIELPVGLIYSVDFLHCMSSPYLLVRQTELCNQVLFQQFCVVRYKLSLMKPCIKPLGISNKVSLRIDDTGLACFQFMVKMEDNRTCYIEFYVSVCELATNNFQFTIPLLFHSARRMSIWKTTEVIGLWKLHRPYFHLDCNFPSVV